MQKAHPSQPNDPAETEDTQGAGTDREASNVRHGPLDTVDTVTRGG